MNSHTGVPAFSDLKTVRKLRPDKCFSFGKRFCFLFFVRKTGVSEANTLRTFLVTQERRPEHQTMAGAQTFQGCKVAESSVFSFTPKLVVVVVLSSETFLEVQNFTVYWSCKTSSVVALLKTKNESWWIHTFLYWIQTSVGMMKYLWKHGFYELALHTWRAYSSNTVIENIISDSDEIEYFSYFSFDLESRRGYGFGLQNYFFVFDRFTSGEGVVFSCWKLNKQKEQTLSFSEH